jgi:CelD/BcsL family acetyltransferase involved in cellulose biosynthesis
MKNITVTLDDKTAAWARVYAARKNKSLSRFLGELLHRTMRESREYDDAMQRFLAKQPVELSRTGAVYPSREELHDRASFR